MDVRFLNVENRWRSLVEIALERALRKDPSSCDCEKCRADITAVALNKLKPDYVPVGASSDHNGEHLALAEEAVLQSLQMVKEAPRHSGASEPILVNSNEALIRTVLADVLIHQTRRTWSKEQLAWALAHSLNEIGPKYTTTPKGDVYARVDEMQPGHLATVYSIVYNALKQVEMGNLDSQFTLDRLDNVF